jgi:hypothetical protein
VIAGVVDTGDKFIAGDNDTGDNLKYREWNYSMKWLSSVTKASILV